MTTIEFKSRCFFGLTVLVCAVGCSVENPKAEFAWRESTLDLLPEARRAAMEVLENNFGKPDHLVAWERMPVDYGGVRGVVATPADDRPLEEGQIAVELSDSTGQINPGDRLLWLVGGDQKKPSPQATVTSVDGNVLGLSSTELATPGTAFAVNFGHKLQLGRAVYMKNCLHCHGVAGDGAGPTARYLNPRPRDYRLGVFKFTSTLATERVTRDDLWRVVKYGIPGTYMPSFLLLDDDETHAVVEYVRWLAMRGELEKRLGDELVDYSQTSIKDEFQKAKNAYEAALAGGNKPESVPSLTALANEARKDLQEYLTDEFADTVDGTADFIAENWARAEEESSVIHPSVPRVPDTEASRQNGRLLYLSDKAKCYTCHGTTGRGNGSATEDYWPKPGSTEKYAERGLHDVWGHVLPPRNLRLGQYRGGRRPVDVFRRVYAGIKGTPMPAFGGTVLKDEEIWDIVNYVMSLPYEPETPSLDAGRAQQVAARPAR